MTMQVNAALGAGAILLQQNAADWLECFKLAGKALVDSHRVTETYIHEMISAFEELGPYMVIAPGIALAHGRPSAAVIETGLSLITLKEPVAFGSESNDPVRLVIGLAAVDHDSHLDLMAALSQILMDETKVNILLQADKEALVRQTLS
ncbi:MAG: PTS sugar transporter subunit IIA [Micrococcales bacterium]|jgi:PTS system ascorbate-specific IIA component|nr:PTS sugar transporter subunit IIA [Actinomycetota bacterium]NCA08152.1 PTS sugar transporter subunit IIA [Micrococcales bacterium]